MDVPAAVLDAAHARNLHDEEVGVRHRMAHYYGPMFRAHLSRGGRAPADARVLDCGCGNGLSAECLVAEGFRASGIDAWSARVAQWHARPRVAGVSLAAADATALPFADGSFDIVMSCGLLEHIGVAEQGLPVYRVAPLADQQARRRRFLSEALRVLAPGGLLIVDHPNGAFPIDFWHGDHTNAPRWHWPSERFLPTFAEVSGLLREIDPRCVVRALSPAGRFTFRRSARRWYGRLLADSAERYFAAMRIPGLRWLARSAFNPYLVLCVERPEG